MGAIYYDKRTAISATATTSQDGYPASNVMLESLGRPWRSTGTGANEVTVYFSAAVGVHTLFLHDVNFSSCTIEKSVDGTTFSNVGTLTTYVDRHGRRRGKITINDTIKAIRIKSFAATPTDGLSYWRIGAVYPFGSTVTPTAPGTYTYRVRTRRPRVRAGLQNGQDSVASTGANIDRIELTFDRKDSELVDDVVQKFTNRTCLWDMALSNYPEQLWPARLLEEDVGESFTRPKQSTLPVVLTEVV